jgi:hypothetical protein
VAVALAEGNWYKALFETVFMFGVAKVQRVVEGEEELPKPIGL